MFDNLSDKLDKALHLLKGHGKITDVNVADTLKEVRRALLDADVNFKIAKDFTTRVKDKAIGANVLTTLQPGQLMVKIVKDELTELMGGDAAGINLSGNPSVILMSGLQGSGKTTFSGKLANFLKTKKLTHFLPRLNQSKRLVFYLKQTHSLTLQLYNFMLSLHFITQIQNYV